ncbi:cephalosporin hydroxylase family protein [Jiella marina]|uniref:cephalosporin hydroxylase family protein n=1 Tax=Jiella sp. LLJ827 TaxID=2917712 RepID=UPI002100D45C|nr:cephalosporin hydroxylase family protein [Jiella sp. LLJ827]
MRRDVEAGSDAKLTLSSGGRETTVDLYSEEGMALVDALRLKQAAEFKRMYEPRWLGVPIIQLPEDIVAMQELIWHLQPDMVVECGVAHGGSLALYAAIMELIGKGRVIGVDVDIRPHNRTAIEAHPLAHRIDLVEASSIDPATVEQVERRCEGAGTVMVVLDSNHSYAHVAEEIRLYERLVTPGSYLVVMDGAQALVADIPRGKPEWAEDNPLTALREFLASTSEFEPDRHFERFGATCVPDGFLRRRAS